MRIIVDKATREVKYVVPEGANVLIENDRIEFADLVICDLNATNSEVIPVELIPEKPLDYCYADGFIAKAAYRLTLGKIELYKELEVLRAEMAGVILQVKLTYDIEPEGLTRIMPLIREMYQLGKAEIAALTVENVSSYVLRSPKYEQVLSMLKTFL